MAPQGKAATRAKPPASSPARRPALSPDFIARHKQRRIMDALAELSAEQGYESTKISDIVRRAGVARKTLYDNFEGKEQVFLAAFDAARDEAFERIEARCAEAEEGWREKIEAGLGAFLGYVAEQPALARVCMVEALSATAATIERYEAAKQRLVEMTGEGMPYAARLPETIDETLVGGVAWIVYRKIRSGEAEQAEQLLPELTEFMLAPSLEAGADSPT
jgi:AcrR family transcriptional regulator